MTYSRKLETLEHFKKYSNHLIFIVLIGLLITFGFSIREELKVGNNDGTLRIQAEYDKAEKSSAYTQKIHDITVNGISIKEDDVVKNEWDYSALDIVEPYYNTGGQNQEELVIKVSEPIKTVSFYYSENTPVKQKRNLLHLRLQDILDSPGGMFSGICCSFALPW